MRSVARTRVSLLAMPEVAVSSLTGMYEVLASIESLASILDAVPNGTTFMPEIVSADRSLQRARSGLPLGVHRHIDEVERTDIVIVPAVLLPSGRWTRGRHPILIDWLRVMHERGAMLCSACSGVLLLAETGLLNGRDATIHWAYAPTFRHNFPEVNLRLQEVLVACGTRSEFIMSGASASWHDLVLHLIARIAGPTAALAIAKFYLLQWHVDGQAPYVTFLPPTDHGDAVVLELQEWLRSNFATAAPVEELVARAGLPPRTLKRRFKKATGFAPIAYVQELRIEEAKKRLERTDMPVEEIGWAVGYQDPAFFRRLFKRLTRLSPAAYRRRFRAPRELQRAGTLA